MNKCVRVCFADFIISHGNEIFCPNYFIFIGNLKTGGGGREFKRST